MGQSSSSSNNVTLYHRLSGIAIDEVNEEELKQLSHTSLHINCCQQTSNGDWYKLIFSSNPQYHSQEYEQIRILPSLKLFTTSQPPILRRILFLPVQSSTTTNNNNNNQIEIGMKLLSQPKLHLNVGDCLGDTNSGTLFVVVDLEPRIGGIIDTNITDIYLDGPVIQKALKVRFAPMYFQASNLDRERCLKFLSRFAGRFFISLNEIFQDDYGKQWSCVEIVDFNEEVERGRILAEKAAVSIGWIPETKFVAECQNCYREVGSPTPDFMDFAFGCPFCDNLVANPSYPVWLQAEHARIGPAQQLLLRLKAGLSLISSREPRALVLGTLITRLPKLLDGTLDFHAIDEVAARVLTSPVETISTPKEVLDRLPISTYNVPINVTVNEEVDEEEEGRSNDRCEICLDRYIEGCTLRTLPCFHRFHVDCCDDWLKVSRSCPLCKTEVDVQYDPL